MNIFRDSSIRTSVMLLCGMLVGTAWYFEVIERTPFSPLVASAGLVLAFFSVSARQCVQNLILSYAGFVLGLTLISISKLVIVMNQGGDPGDMAEKFGDMFLSAATYAPVIHLTWLLAMPVGYGLRRMVKGERVKKTDGKKPSRR